jgi:hypothetical protein
MSRKKLMLVIVTALIIVLVGVYFLYRGISLNSYSVVYMSNQEVLVGRLVEFPRVRLFNPYLLDNSPSIDNPEENNFQLTPIGGSLWGANKLYINSEQVLFHSVVSEDSDIFKALNSESI